MEENLRFFSRARLFPMKNIVWLLVLSRSYVMDVPYPLNQTPLGFPSVSDDIRVYVQGRSLGVCTSEFLAKPPNPGDGVRRITVSASLGGGVTVCLQDLNLV